MSGTVKIIIFSILGLVCVAGIWFGLRMFGIIGGGGRDIPQEQAQVEEAGGGSGFDMGEPAYAELSDEMREAIGKKMGREGFLFAYGTRCLMSMKVPAEIGKAGVAEYKDAYMDQVVSHCDNDDEASYARYVFDQQGQKAGAQFKKDGGEGCGQAIESLAETAESSGLSDSIWHKALKNMRK